DWSSDVCSSDLEPEAEAKLESSSAESNVNASSGRQTMTGAADRTIEKKAAVRSTSESIAAWTKRHKITVAAVFTLMGLLIAAFVYSALTFKERAIDSLAVL